ncbi:hypothetical protein D4S03_10990 [bacterium]|nr:MAG: hypothetical protein D4S03_10990 [bacterium]
MNEQLCLITQIGLAKLFLWMEAERFESYPEAFSQLHAEKEYTKKSLARDTLRLISANGNSGKLVRGDFMYNFYGLERTTPTKISIRGVNALREVRPGIYSPTTYALIIGEAFRNKEYSLWFNRLAQMVARYEVRTRLMLFLLGLGGYTLSFPDDKFFGPRSSRAKLTGHGLEIYPFMEDSRGFNELLQTHCWSALGPWWNIEIQGLGLEVAHDFVFEGLREPKPPLNKLSGRLKNSLFLMKHLGILESQAGEWRLNPIQTPAILGEDIAQDFVTTGTDHSPIQRLKNWQEVLHDELGFVVVVELVQRWAEYKALSIPQAEVEFDSWMRQQTYHGHVHILETHAGQPRLGRGLYGDDTMRKIRFEINLT